jgi:hypothetical protein
MGLSDGGKILILIVLVVVVLYFLKINDNNEPIHNEGILTQDATSPGLDVSLNDDMRHSDMNESIDLDSNDNMLSSDTNSNELLKLKRKMSSRNSSRSDDYKNVNYSGGERSSKSSTLDKFFEGNHPQDSGANAGFSPMLENEGKYAAYLSDKGSKNLTDKDKFNAGSLLPKEKSGEWFDDPYEATSVKVSNAINIFRPIGVNTTQTSGKNPSHDIRGTIPNPKYAVAPWLNSSYEPDTNIRFGSFC